MTSTAGLMTAIGMARDATPAMRPSPGTEWVVLYDRDCGFCRWSFALVLRADRARSLRPLALGTAEADALLSELGPKQRMASWHLIAPDGARESAGAALPTVVSLLRGGGIPAAALARMPRVTDRGYRWVAGHRTWLSRLVTSGAKRRATALIDARTRELT
jgi:predicted DCC family thiol-disulfide oxidoreductase YuxK